MITSLCEDVFSLAGVQLRTIRGSLTRRSETLVLAVGVIFKALYEKQIQCRDLFLEDFESCCAAANDFVRMGERCEDILSELMHECNLGELATHALEELQAALLGLYSGDAIFSAQYIHMFVFEPIEEAISNELFGKDWLDICTHNDFAMTLVRTLEDFLGDLAIYLDEFMVGKAMEALLMATVNFYVQSLLRKSATRKDGKKSIWSNDQKALMRMRGDFRVFKDYFESKLPTYPSISQILDEQFEILDIIHELLSIAAKHTDSNTHDFVFMLQKRIRSVHITKLVVGDLWHLIRPSEEREVHELLDDMEENLQILVPTDEYAIEITENRKTVPGLRLDQAIAMVYDEGMAAANRLRPIVDAAKVQMELTMKRWRKTLKKAGKVKKKVKKLHKKVVKRVSVAAAASTAAAVISPRSPPSSPPKERFDPPRKQPVSNDPSRRPGAAHPRLAPRYVLHPRRRCAPERVPDRARPRPPGLLPS